MSDRTWHGREHGAARVFVYVSPGGGHPLAAVLNRNLIILGLSETISNIGIWIAMMAIMSRVVFTGGGGVAESGGIALAGLAPVLLLSPLAGWLCDRYDLRLLMALSRVLAAVWMAGLVVTQRVELVYLLLVLESASSVVMTPARQAAVPMLVKTEQLTVANAFLQQLGGITKVGAPLVGGALLTILTPAQAIGGTVAALCSC